MAQVSGLGAQCAGIEGREDQLARDVAQLVQGSQEADG
jgi:hypothetical protein